MKVSGKTIRRLERSEVKHPHELTLNVLAGYYALNVGFIQWLSQQEREGDALHDALRNRASEHGVDAGDVGEHELALMLARQREPAATRREPEASVDLSSDFGRLNERRQRMLLQFARELRLAQSEETRRRSEAA